MLIQLLFRLDRGFSALKVQLEEFNIETLNQEDNVYSDFHCHFHLCNKIVIFRKPDCRKIVYCAVSLTFFMNNLTELFSSCWGKAHYHHPPGHTPEHTTGHTPAAIQDARPWRPGVGEAPPKRGWDTPDYHRARRTELIWRTTQVRTSGSSSSQWFKAPSY